MQEEHLTQMQQLHKQLLCSCIPKRLCPENASIALTAAFPFQAPKRPWSATEPRW